MKRQLSIHVTKQQAKHTTAMQLIGLQLPWLSLGATLALLSAAVQSSSEWGSLD